MEKPSRVSRQNIGRSLFALVLLISLVLSTRDVQGLFSWTCMYISNDSYLSAPHSDYYLPSISDKELDSLIIHGRRSIYNSRVSDSGTESVPDLKPKGLFLDALVSLTDHQASSLAKFKGLDLRLGGIKKISDRQLESICLAEVGNLWLGSLTSLSTKQASLLANSNARTIYLDGLKRITDSIARIFSFGRFSILSFSGLDTITDSQTLFLSGGKFRAISLAGLDTITDTQAEYLSHLHREDRYGYVYDSLLNLYEDTDSLSRFWEALNQIQVARFLDDGIILDSLSHISDSAAVALSRYRGNHLQLWNLKSLNDAQAKALAQFIGGDICFGNLDDESRARFEKYRTQFKIGLGYRPENKH